VAGNLLLSPDTCFQVNRHIGLLFGERLDTLFTSSDVKISGFTLACLAVVPGSRSVGTIEKAGAGRAESGKKEIGEGALSYFF